MKKKYFVTAFVLLALAVPLLAQSHTSVPLDDPVYYALEQAQMRGLCAPLPGVKPYSRAIVLRAINEILANEGDSRGGRAAALNEQERAILEQARVSFSPAEPGLDLTRGTYRFANGVDNANGSGVTGGTAGEGGVHLSGELGLGFDFVFGGGLETGTNDFQPALDTAIELSLKGDLGLQTSYDFSISGGVFRIPRKNLDSSYERYYPGFTTTKPDFGPTTVTTYSEPLSFFPYTYKKHWDTFVWNVSDVSNSGHKPWPDGVSIGYSMHPEFAGEFLDGHVFFRAARLDREWAAMTNNASLVLNQTAEPFLGVELTATPFSWLAFSSLVGVLEYDFAVAGDLKRAAEKYQNGFSVNLLEVNIFDYVKMDVGSTAIWPKRFELGYLFPLAEKFLYQNNVGDFDNMSLFFNLRGQYPGLGKLWFSFYLDEANPVNGRFFELDKQMFAFQFGASVRIPWLAFSSITVSYTKIEPYTYTHDRIQTPWYGDLWIETGYTNSGSGLGSYLPPNSDEILVRLESMPFLGSTALLQYQLIRHGADFGLNAVDGSSYYSELDPDAPRNTMTKDFLNDGAYEWMHIVKLGGEYTFASAKIPIKLFAELGCVYSHFTNTGGNSVYSDSFRLIGTLGVKVFPK